MPTEMEKRAKQQREDFIESQSSAVQLATRLTEELAHHVSNNSPAMVAHYLATAMKNRAWEGVVKMNRMGEFEVISYPNALDWIRAHLFMEPDEIMRVASPYLRRKTEQPQLLS